MDKLDKLLKLYTYEDGVSGIPFPLGAEDPIEIGAFRYDATRMGGAPTITATVMYPTCLDEEWTDTVYTEFNDEKYYLKQTPTSSYSNSDARYKHEIELVSERVILDNVYFFDAVKEGEIPTDDKPVSNSTKVVFFGDVKEFAKRLQASLSYSGIDYSVVVDDKIKTEEKLMSFEDQFFSNVLQEVYNVFEVPYYFVGKTIHIGFANDAVVPPTFAYGVDDALLSITKNNANFKVVNRATGKGSTENIPFYYPNNSPKGEITAISSREGLEIGIADAEKFGNTVEIDDSITFRKSECQLDSITVPASDFSELDSWYSEGFYGEWLDQSIELNLDVASIGQKKILFSVDVKNIRDADDKEFVGASYSVQWSLLPTMYSPNAIKTWMASTASHILELTKTGNNNVYLNLKIRVVDAMGASLPINKLHYADIKISLSLEDSEGWEYKERMYDLKDFGLLVLDGTPTYGDTITQKLVKYVKTSQNLMPSIYRENDGAERFYNALSNTYVIPNSVPEEKYEFSNPYVEGKPKEHIVDFEDIKPTIKEATNEISWVEKDENGNDITVFQRIDMFSEFAYDEPDSDETYEDEEDNNDVKYKHSYFFAKLRKLPFNLFDHAIENQPMTISFTSGDCGACKFTIGVTEGYPQKNPVRVNADGTLERDEEGRVVCGVNKPISDADIQEKQQDTTKEEVWIALLKEDETYGIVMPKAPDYDENGVKLNEGHRPKACSDEHKNDGDSFVILGINLPKEYILAAEKKLEEEIIKYMKENNEEKFTFSIGFSRIYFEENPDVLQYLNENSRINVTYNGKTYLLYVTSYSYQMSEGDALPQISVELDESLTVSQNALQNAISEVKTEVGRALSNIDVLALSNPYFIRKDIDDEAQGKINFKKGVKFGEGGKVEVLDNNSAKLTIEYLEVTKKASFTSLEIQEKTHVGGQMLITPAAINCGEVEEFDDFYRCYFQTKGVDGDEIFNQFAIGDQAICQTYNAWGSRYYWRLVIGIGEDYIDLSKTECDEDSGIPSAGDKIIQLGNQVDTERQNAIVIAAYGDGSPYIIQYKGIDNFEIPDSKIVTKLSSTENIFTGKVHMEMGSDGLENIDGGLNIGGQNLLRNSGFTGNYLSDTLADGKVLEETDEMFNPPLAHWDDGSAPATNASVQNSEVSASGKEVSLSMGSITQTLYQKTIANETYTLSFKAKGTTLTYSIGGVTKQVALTEEWAKYSEKITMIEAGSTFAITDATCVLCDIQLERGTIATAWGNSPFDNNSDRAYWQSMKYLQDAMDGASEFYGGLALTETLQVGDYDKNTKSWTKVNGGVNGVVTNEGDDVAFWAGGTLEQATSTMMKYLEDPNFQPTEEEVAAMAKAVITHGGRAILNDIILRGIIYAKGGSFGDLKIGKYVNACGSADAEDSVYSELRRTIGDIVYSTVVKMSAGAISSYGSYNTPQQCFTGNAVIIDSDANLDDNLYKAVMYLRGGNVDAMHIEKGDIKHLTGQYKGLRTPTRVITEDCTVDPNEDSVIIADSTNNSLFVYVPTPNSLLNGAFIEVHNIGNAPITLDTDDEGTIHYKGTNSTQRTLDPSETARLVFSGERDTWYMTII